MRLEIHREARGEMREAVIRHETGYPAARRDFASELESLIGRIREMPRMYPVADQPDIRRALMRRPFPYALHFREIENGIEIIALSHLHRKPGYWLNRI